MPLASSGYAFLSTAFKSSTYNGLPVFEDNRDVEFFEDSFVTQGADPQAKILERVASRGGNRIQRVSTKPKHAGELVRVEVQSSRRGLSLR